MSHNIIRAYDDRIISFFKPNEFEYFTINQGFPADLKYKVIRKTNTTSDGITFKDET